MGVNTEPRYYNITVGFRVPLKRNYEDTKNKFTFIQLQSGYFKIQSDEDPFWGGFGGGIKFVRNKNKITTNPFLTLSYGFLVFAELDYSFSGKYGSDLDLGLLGILPLPLTKINWD